MFAAKEIDRIRKTGSIDNRQVACLTDELAESIGEGFARRFVDKVLDDAEIVNASGFSSTFTREKFAEVNRLWQSQDWNAKHRLANVASADERKRKAESAQRERETEATLRQQLATAQKSVETLGADLAAAKEKLAQKERKLSETEKKCSESVAQIEKLQAQGQKNEAKLKALTSVFPDEVSSVATKFAELLPEGEKSRVVIYLYLSLVASDLKAQFSQKQFALFDAALYQLLENDTDKLKSIRQTFEGDLNPRLGDLMVSWDLVGMDYNENYFKLTPGCGQTVTKVLSALVTRKSDGSVIVKASVKTD